MKNKKTFTLYFCFGLFLFLPGLTQAQGIEIESGSSIVVSGAATIEIKNGNFINNGVYTKALETITFSGDQPQAISGSGTTVFNNLVITNTTGTSISSGTAVTAANLTTTGGIFIVNSDGNSNGSLIVEGVSTGNVTYNRWMTKDKWHLISSPVSESVTDFITANATYLATNNSKYGLAVYDNAIANWGFYTSGGTTDNFVAGKGYEILRKTNDGTFAFTGTLETSVVNTVISENTNGWNLVGNPFPCAINGNSPADDTNNFISVNTSALNDAYEAIYVWDAATSSYLTVNHSFNSNSEFYVAPGQAFFVYSVDGGSTLDFTKALQTHQSSDIFKNGEIPFPSIKLIAEREKGISSTNIKYIENMTIGLNPGYDAGRFSAGDNSFAIYTHLVGDESNKVSFDIQCLPEGEFDNIIPVGLNSPANTKVVFRAEATNLPSSVPVIFEDRQKGIFTDLTKAGSFYPVTLTEKAEGSGRFFLHTQILASTAVNSGLGESGFTIILRPQNNTLRVIGNTGGIGEIAVYDLLGRKLIQRPLHHDGVNEINIGELKSGAYIVLIHTSNQNVSKKISWIKD